jgi:peroxiredoxin family protein
MTARDRLSLVLLAGDYDRVHYALTMAAAAAATARPVTLFFTMGALRALMDKTDDGAPGWFRLGPSANGDTPEARDAHHKKAGIATLEELIEACVSFDANFGVCEMGLRAEGIEPGALRPDIPIKAGGLVTFFAEAEQDHGHIVVI